MKAKLTKKERILNRLTKGDKVSITQLERIANTPRNCVRARVTELRNDGFNILSTTTKTGKAGYRLV